MLRDPVWKLIKWYSLIAIALFAVFAIVALCSCSILKKRQEVKTDSTKVVKVDSGSVKINSVTKTNSSTWWREILDLKPIYFPYTKDTLVNNNYYPTRIVREGGTQTIKEVKVNYDSIWNNKLDSLVYKLSKVDKSKKVEFIPWYIWVIFGAIVLILAKQFLKFK